MYEATQHAGRAEVFWPAAKRVLGGGSRAPMPVWSISSPLAPMPQAAAPSLSAGLRALAAHFAAASVCGVQPDAATVLHVDAGFAEAEATLVHGGALAGDGGRLNKPFTVEELSAVLARLPHKSSVGPDDVPFGFLQNGGDRCLSAMLAVCNASWRLMVVPRGWREANVLALFKGDGDESSADNYRPISLTSTIARVVEHLIQGRLLPLLDAGLCLWQSGFRPGRSCLEQVSAIVERVRAATGGRGELPVAFLDIRKAFDRVWHRGLLFKLYRHFGISGRCWAWIRAFLSGRRIRTTHLGRCSAWHDIAAGVPQGSVLAPALFLVFIDDLAVSLLRAGCDPPMFADDTALMPSLKACPPKGRSSDGLRRAHQREALQRGLDECWQWSCRWCVEWGFKKCACVVFHNHRQRPPDADWQLRLGPAEVLQRATSYRYLGVDLHEKLHWGLHVARVLAKARFVGYRIMRLVADRTALRPTLPVIRMLVLACLRSSFAYALPLWLPNQQQMQQLQSCIVQPLRRCLGLPRTVLHAAVLAECAVPDLATWIEHLALRMARRTARLPDGHYAKVSFMAEHATGISLGLGRRCTAAGVSLSALLAAESPVSRFSRRLPLGQLTLAVEARWFGVDLAWRGADDLAVPRLSYASPKLKLTTKLLLRRCWLGLALLGRAPSLRALKGDRARLAPYLRHDCRPMAALRARLRLDVARLNRSLCHRHLVDSALCQWCPEDESPSHTLSHCRMFAPQRRALLVVLARHELARNDFERLLLGEWPKKLLSLPDVLSALDQFLRDVQEVRQF